MVVRYDKKFIKQYRQADPKIKSAWRRRRELFRDNPYHSQLNNHALRGKYRGLRSINVIGDWRALYEETTYRHGRVSRQKIIFKLLGTHSQLYKK